MKTRILANKLSSIPLMLLSVLWAWRYTHLLYSYHFKSTLYYIMLPDWLLAIHIAAGIAGFVAAVMLFFSRIKPPAAYLFTIGIIVAAYMIEYITLA